MIAKTCSKGEYCCEFDLRLSAWRHHGCRDEDELVEFCPQTGDALGVDDAGQPTVTPRPSDDYVRLLEQKTLGLCILYAQATAECMNVSDGECLAAWKALPSSWTLHTEAWFERALADLRAEAAMREEAPDG